MKLHLANSDGVNAIRGYSGGEIRVNTERYASSVLVLPESIKAPWGPASLAELTSAHIDEIIALDPEVVLLGTGERLEFPQPAVVRGLADAGIGLEVMDTAAACRTYSIIMAEGRTVAAALINPGQA